MGKRTLSVQILQFYVSVVSIFLLGCVRFTVARNEFQNLRRLNTENIGQIEALYLIDADTDLPIQELRNGSVISTALLGASNFNVEARTINGTVGSVRFSYNNISNYRTENALPFVFCGNTGKDYLACSVLVLGEHTIKATPFYNQTTRKPAGTPFQVTFTITNSLSLPTKSPTMAPASLSPTLEMTSQPTYAPLSCSRPQFLELWQPMGSAYPIETEEPQGLLVGNDFIQFSGYTMRFANATNLTYARDVTDVNSTWRRMEDVPVDWGITHVPTVAVGSKVYLCGGYSGAAAGLHIPHCFVYDHAIEPGNGQWSRLPNLPHGGSGGGGMIFDRLRNALYYTGGAQRFKLGSTKATDVNNTYRYSFNNPAAGWVATSPLPYKANHLSYVTHTDVYGRERHFFLGGQEKEFECCRNVADNFEFIAATETWVRRSSMPMARGHASASTRPIGCGFIVAGGSINAVNGSTFRVRTGDISYYDLSTDTWSSLGSLPTRGATPLVDIHPNGYMYTSFDKWNRRKIG